MDSYRSKGWDVSKKLQKQYAELPVEITGDGAGTDDLTFAIDDVTVVGLANLKQLRGKTQKSSDGVRSIFE